MILCAAVVFDPTRVFDAHSNFFTGNFSWKLTQLTHLDLSNNSLTLRSSDFIELANLVNLSHLAVPGQSGALLKVDIDDYTVLEQLTYVRSVHVARSSC